MQSKECAHLFCKLHYLNTNYFNLLAIISQINIIDRFRDPQYQDMSIFIWNQFNTVWFFNRRTSFIWRLMPQNKLLFPGNKGWNMKGKSRYSYLGIMTLYMFFFMSIFLIFNRIWKLIWAYKSAGNNGLIWRNKVNILNYISDYTQHDNIYLKHNNADDMSIDITTKSHI